MISWKKFEDQMNDILSSGDPYDLTNFHRDEVTVLMADVHENDLATFLTRYYAKVEPTELREGELEFIAESTELTMNYSVTFK